MMGLDITGLGSVADFAETAINKIFPDKMGEAEKQAAKLELRKLADQRETALLDAQKSIITAELDQGDNYTKRARPTVVYAGLAFTMLVHVIFPIAVFFTGQEMPELSLPSEFWWAWSGICSAWVIGRSAEKRGAAKNAGLAGQITKMVTGAQ